MRTSKNSRRPYLAAMVLGTALAALGSNGQAGASEISGQAISGISRYCTACWRNARLPVDRWNDCTQEVFQRLLERLDPKGWDYVLTNEGAERREFIRAIDAVRKRIQRERRRYPLLEEGLADAKIAGADRREERDAVRQAADAVLSPRQQKILHMLFEGWSIPEVAREIASTPERVSDEKYKAVQKLRGYFGS